MSLLKPTRVKKSQDFVVVPLNVRVTFEERDKIEALAVRLTGGNISEYIRYAALNFKPTKKDLK